MYLYCSRHSQVEQKPHSADTIMELGRSLAAVGRINDADQVFSQVPLVHLCLLRFSRGVENASMCREVERVVFVAGLQCRHVRSLEQ